ncbi:helix-turn-helix domain-containing protein [Cellulomonas sp. S1-8]|uniref:helix-turn-helix domain-containing protein n=1 Tax=Cellulomonas sp. S1-8 TaxID=2904790 RepID=UPI0022442C6D|nr:helix-turn-helix transcriptional regulator [Cellulomonas sp. S1-8]UZN03493.1 helix-turn-helix domain-containing protein [Cellulomonas sp. S1-8]
MIANARRERRWTARDLAARAGISVQTLRNVERGEPTVAIGVVFEIAALLGIPLFSDDRGAVSELRVGESRRALLLPQRVRASKGVVDDNF